MVWGMGEREGRVEVRLSRVNVENGGSPSDHRDWVSTSLTAVNSTGNRDEISTELLRDAEVNQHGYRICCEIL